MRRSRRDRRDHSDGRWRSQPMRGVSMAVRTIRQLTVPISAPTKWSTGCGGGTDEFGAGGEGDGTANPDQSWRRPRWPGAHAELTVVVPPPAHHRARRGDGARERATDGHCARLHPRHASGNEDPSTTPLSRPMEAIRSPTPHDRLRPHGAGVERTGIDHSDT